MTETPRGTEQHTTGPRERSTVSLGLWILLGIMAVTGVTMAMIVVFGALDSVAYSVVWRILVADIYLIISFTAQHRWLRKTAWVGTAVTFLIGLIVVFGRYLAQSGLAGSDLYDTTYGNESWYAWFGLGGRLESAAHILLGTVLAFSLLSLAYRWIARERPLRIIYIVTGATGILAALLTAIEFVDYASYPSFGMSYGQLRSALAILALTGATIVIIAALVQRGSASRSALPSVAAATSTVAGVSASAPTPAQSAAGVRMVSEQELGELVRAAVAEELARRGL